MKEISESPFFHDQLFINGKWVKTDQKFDVLNPYNYTTIGTAPFASAKHVEEAISAASSCFETFRFYPPQERAQLLHNWYQLILENIDELAKIITLEQGKTLEDAYLDIRYGVEFIIWFAEEARRIYGQTIQSDRPDQKLIVTQEPVGVVGAITPWNFPFAMVTRKVAPALAVGCTVVLKPSEETPFIALALAQLAHEAGFPPGAINMVMGDAPQIGKIFCNDRRVRKISFTGSTRVGRLLATQAGEQIKRLSLELGGNAPFIVFESADIDDAIEGALYMKLRNGSQSCICGNRYFVHDSIYDQFVEKFSEKFVKMKPGNGFDTNADYGPLINQAARDRVKELVEISVKEGAKLVCGGHVVEESCIEPTVLSEVKQDMTIANQEIFGPIAPFYRFSSEQEVIDAAIDTPYGLASYLYSQDYSQILRVTDRLKSGLVGVNETNISKVQAPFGGMKESGVGKEGSMWGIHDYLDMKCTCIKFTPQ